jgi:Ca-activated chloride channel family protein
MKLRTLMMMSAIGMIATGAVVWNAAPPAHGSAAPPVAGAPSPEPTPPPPAPVVDRSHFQAGKTLLVEGRLGHAVLPAGSDSQTFLFVDVSGADAAARTPAPLDLSIVVDRSGSMAGKRIANAIAAARTAIQRLRDGDVVSVVSFNTSVDVVVRPTLIDAASRARVLGQLASIRVGGDTCISCGIESAMQLLGERGGMVDRILLLSDGQPTAGVRDVDGFRRIAESCRRMGAAVTTIGVDVSYDEQVMSALARSSNGHHFFVADPSGLPSIFEREMASLARTVASRAELTIDLAPGVFADHVFDRASTGDAGQLVVPLGALSAGDHKTLLVRLRVPGGDAGERPIAAVRLRYDDLAEARPGSCEGQLAARLSTDPSALSPLDPLVSARLSSTEAAETLEAANQLWRAGRADEARGLLSRQQARLEQTRARALSLAPPALHGDVARAFDRSAAPIATASAGFEPPPPATPAPVAAKQAEAQIRQNQAGAFQATE